MENTATEISQHLLLWILFFTALWFAKVYLYWLKNELFKQNINHPIIYSERLLLMTPLLQLQVSWCRVLSLFLVGSQSNLSYVWILKVTADMVEAHHL